jgi:hypothetical protein
MERLVLHRATRARYITMTGSTKDATVFASMFFGIMPELQQVTALQQFRLKRRRGNYTEEAILESNLRFFGRTGGTKYFLALNAARTARAPPHTHTQLAAPAARGS